MPNKRSDEPKKYCPSCLKFNTRTRVESYRNTQLEYCTYHYYMMRGKVGGHYSLEAYVEASRATFKTSLPSTEEMERLRLLEKS